MKDVGFKAIAKRLCVGHAHSWPVRWGCEVTVFGRTVKPGQLVHADKHGFLVVPAGDEHGLLDAAIFMDNNELATVIPATRGAVGMSTDQVIQRLDDAGAQFSENVKAKFHSNKSGEHN